MIKSLAAWYETLLENGLCAQVAEMQDFEWGQTDYAGQTIILSHQLSVPSGYWDKLRHFVQQGGRLIADGLTFFFDEHNFSVMQTGFPLADVMGGSLQEVFTTRGDFSVLLTDGTSLPAHMVKATLYLTTGKPIAIEDGKVLAATNSFGRGKTVWIPSMIGLGARRFGNKSLSEWLMNELVEDLTALPVRFKTRQSALLMRSMSTSSGYLTILINKSIKTQRVPLIVSDKACTPTVLFADKDGTVVNRSVRIQPEETIVIEWTK